MRWLDGTGIVPDAQPILDELQAQGEGRDRKRRAEAEPDDSLLTHRRKLQHDAREIALSSRRRDGLCSARRAAR
jgi:hypothetical protein